MPDGLLIINADDWGRDRETTDRMHDCIQIGSVSSVSAMVFMEDSERAAAMAREEAIDAGLHLNFTTPFSADCSAKLREHQQRLTSYLKSHRLAQVMFHPGLAGSFRYAVEAQIEEFARLYGIQPARLDGHHHMHLCANVLLGKLLPFGTLVRRNFSFRAGEKGRINRLYRKFVDNLLQRRHRLLDYLFVLPPMDPPERLQRIFALARNSTVEVETHPINPDEYRFLTSGEVFRRTNGVPVAPGFASIGRTPALRPAP